MATSGVDIGTDDIEKVSVVPCNSVACSVATGAAAGAAEATGDDVFIYARLGLKPMEFINFTPRYF